MDGLEVSLAYSLDQINRFAAPGMDKLWLCSAYVSPAGVTGVAPLLDSAKRTAAVFGAGPLTDPAAVRHLLARGTDVRLFPHFPDAEFHPKCFTGRLKNGRAWAAVGSANLTGHGVAGNVELLTTVSGEADHPFFRDLNDWLLELQSCALRPTVHLLNAVAEMHAAYHTVAAGTESNLPPGQVWQKELRRAREFISMLQQEALCTYIAETKLFASYKLVMLGLLLNAPEGRLSLSELARRFQAFYCGLEAAGLQPERSTGNPPPLMLHPGEHKTEAIEQLLRKEPRTPFLSTGRVVTVQDGPAGIELAIARSLWSASTEETRRTAYLRLLDRLERYYEQYVGSAVGIRRTMDEAAGVTWQSA